MHTCEKGGCDKFSYFSSPCYKLLADLMKLNEIWCIYPESEQNAGEVVSVAITRPVLLFARSSL